MNLPAVEPGSAEDILRHNKFSARLTSYQIFREVVALLLWERVRFPRAALRMSSVRRWADACVIRAGRPGFAGLFFALGQPGVSGFLAVVVERRRSRGQ